MATTKAKFTSFSVICPFCHDADTTISLDLNDLTQCSCSGCDTTFTPEQAREMASEELARWETILRWIALAAPATGD